MPIEVINTGVYPNDGTGDPLRTAYQKINQNFTQFAPVAFTGQYNSLYGLPSFAKVAYTGLYTDLIGTPVLGLLAFLNTINNSNWFGQQLSINHGGTGQVTAPAAFDALSPMTNWGDIIFGKQYGQGYRLPIGANGQILSVSNGEPSWINPTIPVINEVTNITNQLPAVVLPGEGAYVHYGVASGTNVLSTTVTPAISSYSDGIFIELLCTNYNTGNVTLNNHGLGPVPVRWPDGTELAAHSLIPGGVVYLTYVGGVFQVVAGASAQSQNQSSVFNIQVLTSSGTYTPTYGATKTIVLATGGGGSGGGSHAGPASGQGGESGSTSISLFNSVDLNNVPYIIGAGGFPVNYGNGTRSGGGGNTIFGSPSTPSIYVLATGGLGGLSGVGACEWPPARSSLTAVANVIKIQSSPGSFPEAVHDDVGPAVGSVNLQGGVGGASLWGGAGVGGPSLWTGTDYLFVNGGTAYGYGSAGGGSGYAGALTLVGGPGMQGVIVIIEF